MKALISVAAIAAASAQALDATGWAPRQPAWPAAELQQWRQLSTAGRGFSAIRGLQHVDTAEMDLCVPKIGSNRSAFVAVMGIPDIDTGYKVRVPLSSDPCQGPRGIEMLTGTRKQQHETDGYRSVAAARA